MTLFDMSGKVAVITGSSRGIGRAIAERMAEHGAKVVISSRKQQVCDEVAKAINGKAGKHVALAVAANISTKDDLKHLVEETNRVFGKIDTLVCNAASNPYYGEHNIRVNCIAPGLIKTDFAKALWDNPETLKASTARSPLLRIGEPDEIAGAAVFLASRAGTFMTGQTMVIEGGATIS